MSSAVLDQPLLNDQSRIKVSVTEVHGQPGIDVRLWWRNTARDEYRPSAKTGIWLRLEDVAPAVLEALQQIVNEEAA